MNLLGLLGSSVERGCNWWRLETSELQTLHVVVVNVEIPPAATLHSFDFFSRIVSMRKLSQMNFSQSGVSGLGLHTSIQQNHSLLACSTEVASPVVQSRGSSSTSGAMSIQNPNVCQWCLGNTCASCTALAMMVHSSRETLFLYLHSPKKEMQNFLPS